jgi:peroxiredoxin
VSTGSPEEARAFKEERGLAFPVLVDPRMRAYRAAGMRRGVAATFNLRAITNAMRAMKEGEHQGRTQGDPWQLGGAFVILPGGRVVYEQRSDAAGDHADPEAMLAALAQATAGSTS